MLTYQIPRCLDPFNLFIVGYVHRGYSKHRPNNNIAVVLSVVRLVLASLNIRETGHMRQITVLVAFSLRCAAAGSGKQASSVEMGKPPRFYLCPNMPRFLMAHPPLDVVVETDVAFKMKAALLLCTMVTWLLQPNKDTEKLYRILPLFALIFLR